MSIVVVNTGGSLSLEPLDPGALPGASCAEEAVVVDLVAADVMPKDRQVARGELKVPLPPRFVPGSQAVVRVDGTGELAFARASIDAAGGLRDGVLADRFVAEQRWLVPLPDGLDPVVAAAGTAATADALYALDDLAGWAPGDVVLVLGASSGVGAAAVDVASSRGSLVVAASRTPEALPVREGVVALGYDDLPAAVRAATDAHGADVVIDTVGGPLTALGLRATARRGVSVLLGYLAGRDLPLNVIDLIPTEASLIGMNSGSVPPGRTRELTAAALELLADGTHRPTPVHARPLAEAIDALLHDAPGRTVLLGSAYTCLDETG